VSAGEGAAGQEKAYDLAANYSVGNLAVGAGFSKNKADKQFAVRALYTLGAFTFGGYYQRAELGSTFQPLDGKVNIVRLSGMYAVGASEFHLNFGVAGKVDHIDDTDSRQATVAYNYNLSKRTKVYAFYTKVDNKALSGYATGQAGVDFSSIAAGIRHNF